MAKVKSKGNRSTELKVCEMLQDLGINGWTQHPGHIPGRPDFWFEERGIALFRGWLFLAWLLQMWPHPQVQNRVLGGQNKGEQMPGLEDGEVAA